MRPTGAEDLPALGEIERSAGERFRDYGLDLVADHEPPDTEVLGGYAEGGRSWVAVDDADRPVGYILVEEVDGAGHIEQVSVLPAWQGRGVGRALIEQAHAWATAAAFDSLTLTTFDHIPWNRPLYEHLGFQVISRDEVGPELRKVLETEAAHGLDPSTRVAMRLPL